ncbi:OmpA family protein [Nonomuraea sp. NPDC001023]|uniref:OmpA family protein n=1 Tax=unclassified Nonomuraea TaxID=2593643 RepID=UPI003318D9E6
MRRAMPAAGLAMAIVSASACGTGIPSSQRSPEQAGRTSVPGVVATSSQPSPRGEGRPLGSRTLGVSNKITVRLLALDRVSAQAVVARWRVRNDLKEDYYFSASLAVPWNSANLGQNAIGGVSLLDSGNDRWYFPRGYRNGDCQCTRGWPTVKAGQEQEMVAVFPAPPPGVTRLDVLFPQAPPFLDVPLGQAPPTPLRVQDGEDPVDPDSARVGDPVTLSIVNQVEQAGAAQDDDGRVVSVRLSTDVLFAVNRADLSRAAHAALREVATQIDRSPGDEVRIDGHTDDTGTDAVNDPLSRRRADSVQAALKKLVTRSGVRFRAYGHGSRDPIADNDRAEGRRTNRRVGITFDRPPAAPAGQARATVSRSPAAVPSAAATGTTLPVLGRARAGKAPGVEGAWPEEAEVRVNELTRDAGGYVNLVWTLRNDGDTPLNAWTSSHDSGGVYAEASTSAAALVDGPRRYRPLRDARHHITVGPYLLSVTRPEYLVTKGEEYTLWAMFKPPADVSTVTVQIPGFEPVEGLAIR